MTNRWWTQMGGPDVVYPDRAQEDGKLLVYESEPLEEDLLVTGTPELSIQLASSHGDGAIFVYLEDVAPDGRVTYVTEGQLRLWYRALSPDAPAGHMGPYHTFQKKDGSPMLPSVSEPIRIGLEPTSALFAAKHRIRIALAGHDASCFKRIPAEGNPVWTVSHNATQRSSIVLPVMPQR
jgi:putative CocE/NonD family hydrolase